MRRQFLIAIEGETRDPGCRRPTAPWKRSCWAIILMPGRITAPRKPCRRSPPTTCGSSCKDRLTRDQLFVAAAGDISAADLGMLVDRAFAGLPATGVPVDVPEADVAPTGSLSVLTRNIPQATVIFAQPGIKRSDKDFFAAYLMNYVLGGGGSSSRLMTEFARKTRPHLWHQHRSGDAGSCRLPERQFRDAQCQGEGDAGTCCACRMAAHGGNRPDADGARRGADLSAGLLSAQPHHHLEGSARRCSASRWIIWASITSNAGSEEINAVTLGRREAGGQETAQRQCAHHHRGRQTGRPGRRRPQPVQ